VDSGIGQYAYWLARALPEAASDLDFEVWLPKSDDPLVEELRQNGNGTPRVSIAGDPRRLGSSLRATLRLLASGRALYHSPDWIGVPALPGVWRTVVTVHDLIPLVAPEWVPESLKARHPNIYRAAIHTIVRGASAVLTDTRPWALEIEKHLHVLPERLHIVPLGVAKPRPVRADQIHAARERFGLGEAAYVVTVGRPEPYKGLATVIRAFARARRDERLVIVGMHDPRYAEHHEEVRRLEVEDRVIFTGTVDPDTLECLYRGARAFVTMSRFEGFGLSPLEAMARSVPVLAARTSVSDCTVGAAALLVDPDDEQAAALALRRLLDDGALRERLTRAGREQIARFSWEACARATANVYRQVLRGRSLAPAPLDARKPQPMALDLVPTAAAPNEARDARIR
jgi:alpha-1,3-rhamnosyl/mannosyltransferase